MFKTLDEILEEYRKIIDKFSEARVLGEFDDISKTVIEVTQALDNYSTITKIREDFNRQQVERIKEQCLEIKAQGINLVKTSQVRKAAETQPINVKNMLACLFDMFGNNGYRVFLGYEILNEEGS